MKSRRYIADDINSFLSAIAAIGVGGGSIALAAGLILGSNSARAIAVYLLAPSIPVGIQAVAADARKRAIEADSDAATRRASTAAVSAAEAAAARNLTQERQRWHAERDTALQDAIAATETEITERERERCDLECAQKLDELSSQHLAEIGRLEQEAEDEACRRVAEVEESEAERHALQAADLNAQIEHLEAKVSEWEGKNDIIQENLRLIQDWQVESARQEGKYELLESQQYEFASKIEAIQSGSEAKVAELLECITAERQAGYDDGYNEAASIASLEIEKLKTKIASLEIRLKDRRSREAFDTSLLTLEDALAGVFKPVLIGGEQRVGKGTFCCKILELYGRHCGVVPLVYDNSEAHKADGTWALNGIPATNDPYVMLDLLKAISQKLDSRPIVTDDNIKTYVPIVIAIDELMTCLLALPDSKRQEFVEQLTYLYTRGAKAHVYLIVMNHSLQVQNMKSGETAILNGGLIDTLFLQIALGTGAMNKFVKDRGTAIASPDLEKYKAAYASE